MRSLLVNWALEKSDHRQCLHAAAVVKNSRVLGLGYNHDWIHAEGMAMGQAGPNCKGATLYSLRVNRYGELRMAQPCMKCTRRAIDAGINNVLYSVDYQGAWAGLQL